MKGFYIEQILEICDGKILNKKYENKLIETFCKDTRVLQENDMYIAIKGENFDGNKYVNDAIKIGASSCLISDDTYVDLKMLEESECIVIKVEDTVLALQQLAKAKREQFDIPVVAITGSVGKTSTKDMVASVMNEKYNVLKTQGNLNNEIGLPLTLLNLDNHTAVVLEMGMNNKGEISKLTNIALPTLCVITNVGTSHIGNLGSRENILKAKLEILEGLKESKFVIINNDNDMLNMWKNSDNFYNKITYGVDNDSDYNAFDIKYSENSSEFLLNNDNKVYVPIGGKHFVYNSLCAIAVGKFFEIEIDKILNGIKKFELTKQRMEVIQIKNNVTVINDSYNASFDSMKASVEYLSNLNVKRKIAVLGDMLELGIFSEDLHKQVGEEVAKNKIDILITVGKYSKYIAEKVQELNNNIKFETFENNESASNYLLEILQKEDVVLLKASNSMKFSEILEKIK